MDRIDLVFDEKIIDYPNDIMCSYGSGGHSHIHVEESSMVLFLSLLKSMLSSTSIATVLRMNMSTQKLLSLLE